MSAEEHTKELDYFALIGDSPVLEAGRPDMLDFKKIAEVMAGAAAGTDDPLTIGIYGEWGTGKTSLMRLMEDLIAKNSEAVPVWFNAWKFEKEEHLIVPLIDCIIRSLERCMDKKSWADATKNAAFEIIGALRAIAKGVSFKLSYCVPLVGEVGAELSGKNILEGLEENAEKAEKWRSMYGDAFHTLEDIGKAKSGLRIVVFVDDLDRCLPKKAVFLLEQIKLVMNQKSFTFVLGLNERIIKKFVHNKLETKYGIPQELCKNYLDKIVQVVMPVPQRSQKQLKKFIDDLLGKCEVPSAARTADLIDLIATAGGRNPRAIIRLLNNARVVQKLGAQEGKTYDLVALLIDRAMIEEQFADLRNFVDVMALPEKSEEAEHFGKMWASLMRQNSFDHIEVHKLLKEKKFKGAEGELDHAMKVLNSNSNIKRVLYTEAGALWLENPECRDSYASVSGDKPDETTEVASPDPAAPRPTAATPGGEPLPLDEGRETYQPKRKGMQKNEEIERLLGNMVLIKAGSFLMGSDKGDDDERPVHPVEIGEFKISSRLVTQALWAAVMGNNPSQFKGDSLPVECVSWIAAQEFCRKLREITGQNFRLPTEAEWEYCCRAGSTTEWFWGDDEKDLGEYAWFEENSKDRTHPVATRKPNAWGLHDMYGNVWEWCEDNWHGDYNGAPADGKAWSGGDSARVLRGGSWYGGTRYCRSAARSLLEPNYGYFHIGFRVALDLPLPLSFAERVDSRAVEQ